MASTYIGASKIDLQGVSLKKGPILTASRLVQLVNILPEKKAFFAEFSFGKTCSIYVVVNKPWNLLVPIVG